MKGAWGEGGGGGGGGITQVKYKLCYVTIDSCFGNTHKTNMMLYHYKPESEGKMTTRTERTSTLIQLQQPGIYWQQRQSNGEDNTMLGADAEAYILNKPDYNR